MGKWADLRLAGSISLGSPSEVLQVLVLGFSLVFLLHFPPKVLGCLKKFLSKLSLGVFFSEIISVFPFRISPVVSFGITQNFVLGHLSVVI